VGYDAISTGGAAISLQDTNASAPYNPIPIIQSSTVRSLLRPCCGFVADLLRFKSLMLTAVTDVAAFQTIYHIKSSHEEGKG
jgi:hypothetical protein